MGVKKIIGIDSQKIQIRELKSIFENMYPNIDIYQSESGYIPIQPESVDFIFIHDVLCNINPMYTDIIYSELSRVLKKTGAIYIYGGNSMDNFHSRNKVISFYETMENEDIYGKSIFAQRKKIIRQRQPDIGNKEIVFIAKNTSGLFGDYFLKTIDKYVKTGKIVKRPYYKGECPLHPGANNQYAGRGYYLQEIILSLSHHGIKAHPLFFTNRALFFKRLTNSRFSIKIYMYIKYYSKKIIKKYFHCQDFEIFGIKNY